ncbi:DUF4184 family protein [Sanguibacter sp. 25GB23B1]|uniref:DUF4184 family protein n=1 Tax=unclassified Sanguibacter TaxID=2645534 RepID=UPI0032AEE798
MPYTPVHVLVALPFARAGTLPSLPGPVRRWALPALVAGTMVPDAPIFLDVLWPGADELGHVTHGLLAALTLDVVLALALAALWIGGVGPAVLGALPRRSPAAAPGPALDARRADPGRRRSAGLTGTTTVVAAAVLGILSHLAWDDVTHLRGHAVQAWDVLREPLAGRPLYVYLQHGSSALGVLALLGVAIWWWRRAVPVPAPQHLRSAVVAVLVGAGLGLLGAVARLAAEPGGVTLYALARRSATYPVLGAALAVVVWALVVRTRSSRLAPDGVPRSAPDDPGVRTG